MIVLVTVTLQSKFYEKVLLPPVKFTESRNGSSAGFWYCNYHKSWKCAAFEQSF